MIACIDEHREAYGVEPIRRVLPIAPSPYHAHAARRADPAKASARARRDAGLRVEIWRVFEENFGVYGVRRVWVAAARPRGDQGRALHGGAAEARDGAARRCPGADEAPHDRRQGRALSAPTG